MEEQSNLYDFDKKKTGICRCCGASILPKHQYCDDCMEEKILSLLRELKMRCFYIA